MGHLSALMKSSMCEKNLAQCYSHSPNALCVVVSTKLFYFYFILFLAALGLSCSTQDLSLRHVGFSLVVACGFSLL